MEKHLRGANSAVAEKVRALRKEWGASSGSSVAWRREPWGRCCYGRAARRKRLAAGVTYEPRTIMERRNWTR